MHKRVILALVLVFALLMSTSCSLIIKDEAVDMATPVIEVAGQTITKGEVKQLIEDIHDYNEQMYSYYYGMTYDRTSESAIADAKEQAIQSLIESAVVDVKLTEYGVDVFTEEELAEIETLAKEDYDLYYDTIKNFYFYDTELTGDELEAAIHEEMMYMMGFDSLESAIEQYKSTKAQEKLVAELNKDVTVSEEELTTEYNARVESDKASYTAAAYTYGTALTNGETPYYAPEGFRYVKHILLQFTTEDETAITEIETAIANLAAGEDATELNNQLAAAKEQAYANLQPKVDEITAKLAEGVDFETLIADYNEDPGMNGETEGYPVCSTSVDWVVEFKDASMALANVGDVSDAVRSEYGIHFIKYQSDIASGEIGLETVREALTAELQSTKESSNVETILAQWVEEANAKINEKELNK